MKTGLVEMYLDEMENAAGGELTQDMQVRLLNYILLGKIMGASKETLLHAWRDNPDAQAFIEENYWWVGSTV